MFNVGGGELLIILLVALIFLGPTRLPEVARQFGQTLSTLRSLAQGFQNEIEAAAKPELKGPIGQTEPSKPKSFEPQSASLAPFSASPGYKKPEPSDSGDNGSDPVDSADDNGTDVADGDAESPVTNVDADTEIERESTDASDTDEWKPPTTDPFEIGRAVRESPPTVRRDDTPSAGGPTDLTADDQA